MKKKYMYIYNPKTYCDTSVDKAPHIKYTLNTQKTCMSNFITTQNRFLTLEAQPRNNHFYAQL